MDGGSSVSSQDASVYNQPGVETLPATDYGLLWEMIVEFSDGAGCTGRTVRVHILTNKFNIDYFWILFRLYCMGVIILGRSAVSGNLNLCWTIFFSEWFTAHNPLNLCWIIFSSEWFSAHTPSIYAGIYFPQSDLLLPPTQSYSISVVFDYLSFLFVAESCIRRLQRYSSGHLSRLPCSCSSLVVLFGPDHLFSNLHSGIHYRRTFPQKCFIRF